MAVRSSGAADDSARPIGFVWPNKSKSSERSGIPPVPLNALTKILNGSADSEDSGFAILIDAFVVQSEAIEVAIPVLHTSRSATINYFVEVTEWLELKGDRGRVLFDWEDGQWEMNAHDHYGSSIFWQPRSCTVEVQNGSSRVRILTWWWNFQTSEHTGTSCSGSNTHCVRTFGCFHKGPSHKAKQLCAGSWKEASTM